METSYFGSESASLRIANKLVEDLRHKLRCSRVRLDGSAIIFCDNNLVATNTSMKTPMLNKSHNKICHHQLRQSQAEGKIRVGWVPRKSNTADLLTKTTMDGNVRH